MPQLVTKIFIGVVHTIRIVQKREPFGRGEIRKGEGNQSWLLWPATPRAFLAQIFVLSMMGFYPINKKIQFTLQIHTAE